MGKNYPDQLGEWVKQRAVTRRDRNLAAFLAVRDDVRAALDAGYAAKTIWANMYECKRIPFRYDAFLNYVRRFLQQPDSSPPDASLHAAANRPADPPVTAPDCARQSKPAGFTFNPVPKKEELL